MTMYEQLFVQVAHTWPGGGGGDRGQGYIPSLACLTAILDCVQPPPPHEAAAWASENLCLYVELGRGCCEKNLAGSRIWPCGSQQLNRLPLIKCHRTWTAVSNIWSGIKRAIHKALILTQKMQSHAGVC